jgi:hypothetical protein
MHYRLFSNSSYQSTAKWKTYQIFKKARFLFAFSTAFVIKMAPLVGVSRAAVSKVMMAYTNNGKTSSAKRNSGQTQN